MTITPDLPVEGRCVRAGGAVGNDSADDAPAIQKALDAGGLVVVPPGTYRIGRTLRIGAHTRLWAHPHARLVLADKAGVDHESFLLAAKPGAQHIRIEGGIWDGNNPANPRGSDQPLAYTGVLLNFTQVSDLTLRGLTVRDSETFFIRLGQARRFTIEDIRFQAPHVRPNQDGVHIGGACEDGVLRNLCGVGPYTPADDVVALNADDALFRSMCFGMVCGPIRRIRVDNIAADDCHTFIRLLSLRSEIADVEIRNVRGGCRYNVVNADAARYCRTPLFDPDAEEYRDGVGMLRNVTIENLHVHRTADHDQPALQLETRMRNFRIIAYTRDLARDACPHADTLRWRHTPAPRFTLTGLTPADGDELLARSSGIAPQCCRECRPDERLAIRLCGQLTAQAVLRSRAPRFDLLEVAPEAPTP